MRFGPSEADYKRLYQKYQQTEGFLTYKVNNLQSQIYEMKKIQDADMAKYQQTIAFLTNMTGKVNKLQSQIYEIKSKHNADLKYMAKTYEKQVEELKETDYNWLEKKYQQTKFTLTNMTGKVTNLQSQIYEMEQKHNANLKDMAKKYEKQIEQLKFFKDPSQVQKAEQYIFNSFISQLKPFKMVDPIPKRENMKYVAIVGQNSAGKSSMLNKILGTKLEVGVDDTTQEVQIAHKDAARRLVYFDSPGLNQFFDITNVEYLKAFYSIDIMFIVTAVTFKNSKRTIQVMDKINPPQLYIVRNQCDKFQTDEQFQKAVAKDKGLLQQYQIQNVKAILYVSMKRDDSFRDNAKFRKLMMGE